jgi:DNA-binding NarL/FixJ family response regulator
VLSAAAAGARGYLTEDADTEAVCRAVCQVATGNRYVPPSPAAFLPDSVHTSRCRRPDLTRLAVEKGVIP